MAALFAEHGFQRLFTTTIKPLRPLSLSRNVPKILQYPIQQAPIRTFTHTRQAAMSSEQFFDIVKNRRTYYQLKKESTIDDRKIQDIITQALLHVPSSFNSQSTRIILLVKEEHDKLWEIIKSVLKGIVPAEQYIITEKKLNGFKAGYGTVRSICPSPSI
jgi:hypothetical protein